MYQYVKFFEGQVGYILLCVLCNCIMDIIDQPNSAMPFVVITHPVYELSLLATCHYVAKWQVLIQFL